VAGEWVVEQASGEDDVNGAVMVWQAAKRHGA
jgi:hypothetical protein